MFNSETFKIVCKMINFITIITYKIKQILAQNRAWSVKTRVATV